MPGLRRRPMLFPITRTDRADRYYTLNLAQGPIWDRNEAEIELGAVSPDSSVDPVPAEAPLIVLC